MQCLGGKVVMPFPKAQNERKTERCIMDKMGKYIYGVVNSSTEETFDMGKITGFETASNSKTSNRAYTISFQNMAAVVSDSEIVDYSHIPKDTLGRCLVKHQTVIEKIMKDHTIIPMKFGTFASDETEVAQVLKRGYSQFKELLIDMDGRIELDVAATWDDLGTRIKEIGAEDKQIREFKAEIAKKPPNETLQDKIKIGMMIKDALDKRKEKEQAYVINFLKEVTVDFQKHQVMDDNMILNCAFLLERTKEPDFDSGLKKLDEEYKQKVHFKCVGPLPPYSFATCQLKKVDYSEISEARKLLGLKERASLEGIKESYRQFAQRNHPDRDPENNQLKEEFEKTTKAYKLLTNCCQQDGIPFEDEKKEDFIMVEIVRP